MPSASAISDIRPCRRHDLRLVERHADGRTSWIVQDPLQLNYFYLDQVQHWLFDRFDGQSSIGNIKQRFEKHFSPMKISEQQILAFCAKMSSDGLLCENASGQKIRSRRSARRKAMIWKAPLSVLAIRFPGLNIRTAVDVASLLMGWLFSWPALIVMSLWFVFAFLFSIQIGSDIVSSLPTIGQLQMSDIITFLIAISLVKIVHEFGHAVCCRKMGADCSEIGLMFLVFSPCLYCNVSDAWMLKSKWKRIAVSAAGIYIELIIASCSILLWYYCEAELLRSLLLNLFLVCSVNTLLVNGNPLMRYDGYYVLSDLADVPNLSNQARTVAWNWMSDLCFHKSQLENDYLGQRTRMFLLIYYFASLAYRVLILTAIFWIAYAAAKPFGLHSLLIYLASGFIALTLLNFVNSFGKFVMHRNKMESKRWLGIAAVAATAVVAVYLVGNFKITNSVATDAIVELEDFHYCSATTSGQLQWAAEPGSRVKQGEVIARLRDSKMEIEAIVLKGQIATGQLQVENLVTQSTFDPEVRFTIPAAESRLNDLKEQLVHLNAKIEGLVVRAPVDGVVIAPHPKRLETANRMTLASWSGTLLDRSNLGCTVNEGDVICLVGDPDRWQVTLLIDERKLDLVSPGNPVTIQTELEIGTRYTGTIENISLDGFDRNRDASNPPLTRLDARTSFRAATSLDQPISFGIHGAPAKARIEIQRETIAHISKRFLQETFRLDL